MRDCVLHAVGSMSGVVDDRWQGVRSMGTEALTAQVQEVTASIWSASQRGSYSETTKVNGRVAGYSTYSPSPEEGRNLNRHALDVHVVRTAFAIFYLF